MTSRLIVASVCLISASIAWSHVSASDVSAARVSSLAAPSSEPASTSAAHGNAAPVSHTAVTKVSVVVSPQSPLRIDPVAVTQTEPFALSYRATNTSADTVLQYKLVAFVFTQAGIGRGYHTLPAWTTLASGASRIGTFQLDKLSVTAYDHVVVGVQAAGVGHLLLATSIDELFTSAKRVAAGLPADGPMMASTAFTAFGDCEAGFCSSERLACLAMCNSQGCPVQSFSCNRTECSSSCTCGAKCQ